MTPSSVNFPDGAQGRQVRHGLGLSVGVEGSPCRATIEEFNLDGPSCRIYAAGIRNPQRRMLSGGA